MIRCGSKQVADKDFIPIKTFSTISTSFKRLRYEGEKMGFSARGNQAHWSEAPIMLQKQFSIGMIK